MTNQWRELKETITELRDNDGTATQQEVCKFLANYMDVLEKQMIDPIDRVLEIIDSEAWSYCDYIVKHENGNRDKQGAASHLADNIREAVLALKGGE